MLRIFKYELRRRKNMIFILGGLMTGLSVLSILFLTFKRYSLSSFFMRSSGAEGLLYSITFFVLVFIPTMMFFMCSNGHIDELLYKDTNYLMLTIPVRSEAILGGRMLAGLVEYLIYLCIALVFGGIFVLIGASIGSVNHGFFFNMRLFLYNVFVLNALPVLYLVFSLLAWFSVVGTGFMFVKALTRSFIRKKTLAQILSVISAIFIFSWIMRLGAFLSKEWNLVQTLDLKIISFHNADNNFLSIIKPMEIYLVTTVILFLLAAGFFFITNWLFNKKVEL